MSDFEQYAKYYTVGLKVAVGIPMPNAEVFHDWAIIHEIDEDLVSLQLSRDQLPVNVSLHIGQILELRGGQEGSGYSCRAIIVTEGDAREILLRLIGEIVTDELREFYRIDAFLPIKYYISKEQNTDRLKSAWEDRFVQRQVQELASKDKRWDSSFVGENATLPNERHQETPDTGGQQDDLWDTIIPLAANISGGGIRIITHQGFEDGDYVPLEILIPYPPRIVDAVARVVFMNRNYAAGSDHDYYNTAMQFVFIDERDRDAIIYYISNVQLKRIRQLREKYLFRSSIDDAEEEPDESALIGIKWANIGKRVVTTLFFAIILLLMFLYFRSYLNYHPKNEIEDTFEGGIRRYLEKFK
jgi:hypothetical protein